MHKLQSARAAMRITILVLLCGAGSVMAAHRAQAAVDTDLRAGVFMDANAVGVGAGVLTPVSGDNRWYFNPNMEVGFGDRENIVTMNGDFHYDIPQNSNNMSVWMGAGPALLVTDPSNGETRTNMGLNVLTGIGGTSGQVRPFAQLKGVVANQGQVVLQGGIRF